MYTLQLISNDNVITERIYNNSIQNSIKAFLKYCNAHISMRKLIKSGSATIMVFKDNHIIQNINQF